MNRWSRYALIGLGTGLLARRLAMTPQVRFARMGGTTIAAPSAVGWITDFLNAAYYRRPRHVRDVDDLRLAFEILTTFWHEQGRRLSARDVLAFHRAFGPARLTADEHGRRGTLDRAQLLAGAATLFGSWFPAHRDDLATHGWGITFRSPEAKQAYLPERRLGDAQLGAITPPSEPGPHQSWRTYPAVPAGDPTAALGALAAPERWPSYGSELGRFTPLRSGGLANQTFEIEVLGEPLGPVPLLLRGYVTVTKLLTDADPEPLHAYIDSLVEPLALYGHEQDPPLPPGATPLAAIELTTHDGHFLGDARNRLLLYAAEGTGWLRVVGTWDPLDWQRELLYQRVGHHSQHAFWGMGEPEESMLHQIAAAARRDAAGAAEEAT